MEKREAEGTKPAGRGREKGEARKKDPDGRKRVEEVRRKEGEGGGEAGKSASLPQEQLHSYFHRQGIRSLSLRLSLLLVLTLFFYPSFQKTHLVLLISLPDTQDSRSFHVVVIMLHPQFPFT